MTRAHVTTGWVAVNAVGALVYLYFASSVWPPAELRGLPEAHAGGDAFVWALSAVPAFLACAVLNVAVLAWSGWGRISRGVWHVTAYAWVIPVIWVAACGIDHYRG